MLRQKHHVSSSRMLRKRPTQCKTNKIMVAEDSNWIERYIETSIHLSFGDYDKVFFEEVHLDILRDLCNDQVPSDYVLHLLSLLELLIPLLDSEDK